MLLLPLTGLLVYLMAVAGDGATRDPIGECWMGSVAGIVPGLLLSPAFRAYHPHRVFLPLLEVLCSGKAATLHVSATCQ